MKEKVILLVLVGILFTTVSYAQKVTQSVNGAIIDASAIPHTTVKKAISTDGTNNTMGSNTAANIGSSDSDAKVYVKFEVYKSDNSTGSNWLAAVNLCKNLTVGSGDWRLPTRRELMLMWVLKPELEKIGDFVSFSTTLEPYWSATEYSPDDSWYVTFANGKTYHDKKTYSYYRGVRCVRDL